MQNLSGVQIITLIQLHVLLSRWFLVMKFLAEVCKV